MTDEHLKVTDKRIFTPEGDLREEYRHLEDRGGGEEEAPRESSQPAGADAAGSEEAASEASAPETAARETPEGSAPPPAEDARKNRAPGPGPDPSSAVESGSRPRPESRGGTSGAGFEDLVGVLAQNASVYLQKAGERSEEWREYLQLGQLHIDLLDVLREKTAGNLTELQDSLLEDVLYQLRLAFVQVKRETG